MTRVGLVTDAHLGFARYSKVNENGTNIREVDFYESYVRAIDNLLDADVEAIVDLGDIADTPHPRKRSLRVLIETINATGLPYYAITGNHHLVRHSTDISLLDLLSHYCPKLTAIQKPRYVEAVNAFLIPYGNSDEIKAGLHDAEAHPDAWIGGHWACDDVLPDGHDVTRADLPNNRPILLGHFHGRSAEGIPTYIGATDRKAWGEANNPTGCAVWDSDEPGLTFIDHPARRWIDLHATATDYLDVVHEELMHATDQPIVRLTVTATREEYAALDENKARQLAANTLDFTIRRIGTEEEPTPTEAPTPTSLKDSWRSQVKGASIPKGVKRVEVERIGVDALAGVGVAA